MVSSLVIVTDAAINKLIPDMFIQSNLIFTCKSEAYPIGASYSDALDR
jgi:hypothetical protein